MAKPAHLIAPRISVDPALRFGKPVVDGTRVPIHLVLSQLAAGTTYEELMREYDLQRQDILAVAQQLRELTDSELSGAIALLEPGRVRLHKR